jgi:chromosome segregation and condensation protein ScpB
MIKWNVVLALLQARTSPITAKTLARQAGIDETDDTCPKTRKLIRDLIRDGHCIGSENTGYKLMQTGKEVQEYLNSLLQRQIALSKRIADVYHGAVKNNIL